MISTNKAILKKLRSINKQHSKVNPYAVLTLARLQRYAEKLIARWNFKNPKNKLQDV